LKPSKEELKLRNDCERVATVLRDQVPQQQFRELFSELLGIAQLGLVGASANPALAATTLSEFKERLVISIGHGVRKKYLTRLGWTTAGWAAGFVCCGVIIPLAVQSVKSVSVDAVLIRNYGCMLAAAMAGLWISFAVRKDFTFEDLFHPEADLLGPAHRAIFVALCTSVLALICASKVAGVSLGNFTTDAIATDIRSALLFGGLSGIGERFLGDAIVPRARQMLSGLAKSPREK
jgi:hypothetical protein